MIDESDLINYGITVQTEGNAEIANRKFLKIVHQTLYEFVLLTSHRNWRLAVIEKYKDALEKQMKEILLNIAEAIDESGDFVALWDGKTRTDSGGYEIKDLQERLTAVIPPICWNMIFALEPNVMFQGGVI
jgi:hypothetical protein